MLKQLQIKDRPELQKSESSFKPAASLSDVEWALGHLRVLSGLERARVLSGPGRAL